MLRELEKLHIERFVDTFIADHRRPRWKTILNMNPKHWKKLSTWDLWDDRLCVSEFCSEWTNQIEKLITTITFQEYSKQQVVVIHVGHDLGGIEKNFLGEALLGKKTLFEGIISILPGQLALVINHDGGICVCQRSLSCRSK